ncbi:MAG: branched-chain amino acid ABC transporter permease [Chloroflexi bacterium]|nr:branched-chain amino acid ABC transporter permease [Chloroflexota bacterium]
MTALLRPRAAILVTLGIVAALAVIPLLSMPRYYVAFVLLTLMYISLASSWNIISGFTGYVSFGHVAFFGVGAYAAAIMITKLKVFWLLAALGGGVVSLALAAPLGLVALRLKGPYFAVSMLGLSEAINIIALVWEPVTRGGSGIYLPLVDDLVGVYYALLALCVSVVATTWAIARSKFGLRLLAIREDEGAIEALGFNTTRYKLAAFMLSAFFPGIAGGVYAWYSSFIDPPSVFNSAITIRMIIMTMFGGAGTVLGPVVGGAILTVISEYLWVRFPFLHQALLGVLVIGLVVFLPGGLASLPDRFKAMRLARKAAP